MRVEKNVTFYAGNSEQVQRNKAAQAKNEQEDKTAGKKGTSIFAGDLNLPQDEILQKREEARQKALKVVGDAFAEDRKLDEEIQLHRDKARELQGKIKNLNDRMAAVQEEEQRLQEAYGVEEGSQEQKDTELLCKWAEAQSGTPGVMMTPEEKSRASKLMENGLTEYQSRVLSIHSGFADDKKTAEELKQEMISENAVVRGMRLERLKKNPMVKASKQAEAILEAANKEEIVDLAAESKEHVDEEQEEREEKAEEIKEEKEEMEELTQEILTEETLHSEQNQAEIKKEVEDIVNRMKLIEEDIKGAAVDEAL